MISCLYSHVKLSKSNRHRDDDNRSVPPAKTMALNVNITRNVFVLVKELKKFIFSSTINCSVESNLGHVPVKINKSPKRQAGDIGAVGCDF